ncbi:MAG: GNAT family N-acetyltransferase [Planctomycetaceae bacterium]|jgi:CelD/BcsL family acetyltransferase involved in cellulose biosynthesis|nr:GNAT family N-acetyltransferase [Planctomycetaceae bacterium]
MSIEIQILKSPDEFNFIREEWNALTDRCIYPNAFLRAGWMLAWQKRFGVKLGGFYVLLIRDGGNLIGGLPLFRENDGTLKFLGFDGVTCPEYLGLVVESERLEVVIQELLKFLISRSDWTRFYFEDYALDDLGTSRFVELLKSQFPFWERCGEGRYYISLPDSYEAYLMTRGHNNRSKRRKEFKKAVEENNARLVEPDISELDRWFPELCRLEVEALEHKAAPPMAREDFSSLIYDLIVELMPSREFRVFMLYYGDVPAAFRFGFIHAGKYYDYVMGFDPKLPGRAGNVAVQFVIMKLIDEKIHEFDFLRGLEYYKTYWADQLRQTKTIIFFRKRGLAYYLTQLVENIIRPVWRKIKRKKLKSDV